MYTVALTPMLVGSAAGALAAGRWRLDACLQLILAAVLIIGWLNLTNDAFDFSTGIDVAKAESVVNLLGGTSDAQRMVLVVAHVLLLAAWGVLRVLAGHDPAVLYLLAGCIFAGYTYQGPPFRLGYLGLGEPICYVAWTVAVAAAFHAQTGGAGGSREALMRLVDVRSLLPGAAALVALPTTLILLCSHFHQREEDMAAGKRSPVVRWGTAGVAKIVQALAGLFVVLHVVLQPLGLLPWQAAFMGLGAALPSARKLASFVGKHHANKKVSRRAKYVAVKMHFLHGLALAAGYGVALAQRR